jgi:hypothetical protein
MELKLLQRINGRILDKAGLRLVRVRPTRHQLRRAGSTSQSYPIEDVDSVRFRTSEWIYSVPVSYLVGRPIFGYGPQSWHPLVAASAELLEDIDTPYEASVLKRFYDTFVPATIADACQLQDSGPLSEVPAASLFEPWRLSPPPFDDPLSSVPASGSPLFGPLSKAAGEAEWQRLRSRVRSILHYGYQPELFPRGRIKIVVLRSGQQQRYLVGHGQHRAAVLSAMGSTRLEVSIHNTVPPVVDESEAHMWPHVKSDFLTRQQAVSMLRRYFTTPSSDPALRIGTAAHGTSSVNTTVGK